MFALPIIPILSIALSLLSSSPVLAAPASVTYIDSNTDYNTYNHSIPAHHSALELGMRARDEARQEVYVMFRNLKHNGNFYLPNRTPAGPIATIIMVPDGRGGWKFKWHDIPINPNHHFTVKFTDRKGIYRESRCHLSGQLDGGHTDGLFWIDDAGYGNDWLHPCSWRGVTVHCERETTKCGWIPGVTDWAIGEGADWHR